MRTMWTVMAVCAATMVMAADEKTAPLPIELPKPLFQGTPQPVRGITNLEKVSDKPRPPFMAPEGCTNLAKGKKVTSSDSFPVIGELDLVTDGDKAGTDGTYVELGPNLQWVQIDLEKQADIFAIVVWFFHQQTRAYHDVIVQVSDDPEFVKDVKTVYNNDNDNSAGKGAGKDMMYMETNQGRLIDTKGVKARYVRIYTRGNTSNEMNHYVEVEVWGKAAAK